MFQRNDKALITARIITLVVVIIMAVGSFAMGIALAVVYHPALFLTAFVGWFLCWIAWVFAKLHLSYLCDIKLIRNKLYGESNAGIEDFLKSYWKRVSELGEQEQKEEESEAELAQLQQLLDSGVITKEEFVEREKEIRKGE